MRLGFPLIGGLETGLQTNHNAYCVLSFSQALRELIFGSAKGPSFNAEWRKQSFIFCDLPHLQYGLVQHKVGE